MVVIDTLTVVIRREPDGTFFSEVIDLPDCTARAGTRGELLEATRLAIDTFLGR
jgi:predicted RNase H-like HicB family nuclease